VKVFVIFLGALLMTPFSAADVIRLKNGRSIVADRVREDKGRVEYQIGDNTFAISRSLVEKIETGIGTPGPAPREELPSFTPSQDLPSSPELLTRLVHDGRVDTEALARLDNPDDPELAAAAYFTAARYEQGYGSADRARLYLERALTHRPDHTGLIEHYAATLLQLRRYSEAASQAERATRLAPNSADAFALLGLGYFYLEKTQDAVRAWKRSLELRPNAIVQRYLEQAERDLTAEASFGQQESSHFTLRYEGRQTSESFRRQLLATLEMHYSTLVNELDLAPREAISVILYTEQAFTDVTQAPAWTGALNDGKLRIPVEGLDSVTGELSRILKHELAHSFINQITRNRCPVWLNEGVAMVLEPRTSASHGRQLAQLFAAERHLPLGVLEGSFMRLSQNQATLAYLESLAAVEYIRETYGMGDVVRVLERIGEGSTAEAALRATVRAGYGRLEEDIAAYLKRTYGE
jgi:tetratricopeptide (TPR) repeat protein